MSEEMAVPNHPHADQRNWQPGDTDDDDPDRIIPWEQIIAMPRLRNRTLRTLERMRKLMDFYPPEKLAAAISPHVRIDQIVEMAVYLEEVAKALGKQKEKWTCAECGKLVWCKHDVQLTVSDTGEMGRIVTRQIRIVRPDAHYCSNQCRQKAYRKRKAARYGREAPLQASFVTESESVTDAPLETAAQS
jgi:hypothetical protein